MLESDVCLDDIAIEGISIMNAFDGFPNDMPIKIPEQLSELGRLTFTRGERLMNSKLESFLDYNNIKGIEANYVVFAFDKKYFTLLHTGAGCRPRGPRRLCRKKRRTEICSHLWPAA